MSVKITDTTKKNKAIADVLEKINKNYGQGSAMKADSKIQDITVISSGSIGLNIALGVFGFPKGRIVEIYGPESSGKTTLALHAISECQRAGGTCAFVDAEQAFDKIYAENLGVSIDELIISQPDNGEQALDICHEFVKSGAFDLVVIDSVAALTPKAEIEGEMGDSKMGLHARLMSQAMRKMVGDISKSECCVIFINQLRDKIGVMFGSPETTTGGNALKFYSSIRIDIRKVSQIKDGDSIVGNHVRAKVVKNKVACPFRQAEFDITFGKGINREAEVLDIGVAFEIIKKSGSWFSYGETKLGQGREGVIKILEDNNELMTELENKIMEQIED